MALGIICEYNPFHSGHAWQLARLREQFGGDTPIVCVMSGNFVQRGDFAVARWQCRAEAAMRGGADLVLSLPLPYAIASAEGFAFGGVSVLAATGAVDTLAFGSECASAQKLMRLAEAPESEQFSALLRQSLSEGIPFAAAREAAVRELLGDDADILRQPNDILAVEYCRAIQRRGAALRPFAMQRVGVSHDGGAAQNFASASYLREKLCKGEAVGDYLTEGMAALYEREKAAGRAPVTMHGAERAMLSRLRCMSESEMALYDEGGEGLYHRIFDRSRTACSIAELLAEVKTKRYAYASLRRTVLRMYLGVLPEESRRELPYLRVLACNIRGRALLKTMKKTASLPILTKSADVRLLSDEAQRLFALEARSTDLYTLAYPELGESIGGSEWKSRPVILR